MELNELYSEKFEKQLTNLIEGFSKLNADLLASAKGLKAVDDSLRAVEQTRENLVKSQKEAETIKQQMIKTDTALIKKEQEMQKVLKAEMDAKIKATKETERLNNVKAKATKEAEKAAKALEKENSAYEKLKKQHRDAIANVREMATLHGVNSKEVANATAKFEQLDKKLKSVNNTTGAPNTTGVGKYFQAIMKGAGALGLIAGAAEIAKKMFDVFIGSTQKFKDQWEIATNALSAGVNVLQGSLVNISNGGFKNFNQKLDEAIEKSIELTKNIQLLRIEAISIDVDTNQLKAAASLYKSLADDATLSFDEQLKFGEKAFELQKEAAEQELKLNKDKLDIAIKTNQNILDSGKKLTVDDLKNKADAVKAYDNSRVQLKQIDIDYNKFKRQINLDDFEQELDFIFDVSDKRKTANEKDIANTELAAKERVRILGETKRILEESFDDQINLFNKEFDINIDRNKLLTLNNKESYEYAKSLGMSEKATNRLLEAIRERIAAVSDLEVAQRDLNKTIQVEQLSTRQTDFVKESKFSNLVITDDMKKNLNDRYNANKEYLTKTEEDNKAAADREIELRKQVEEALKNLAWDAASTLGNGLFDLKSMQRQQDLDAIQEDYDNKMALAGDNEMAQRIALRKMNREKAKIDQEQAKADKNQALFNIAISTAQAVMASLAMAPLPVGLPLMLANIAMGALQAGLVLARPIPKAKYDKGTKSAVSGMIEVAEKRPEFITHKGITWLQEKPLVTDKLTGASIIGGAESDEIIRSARHLGYDSQTLQMEHGFKEIRDGINNIQIKFGIDKHGYGYVIKDRIRKTTYADYYNK